MMHVWLSKSNQESSRKPATPVAPPRLRSLRLRRLERQQRAANEKSLPSVSLRTYQYNEIFHLKMTNVFSQVEHLINYAFEKRKAMEHEKLCLIFPFRRRLSKKPRKAFFSTPRFSHKMKVFCAKRKVGST